MKATKKVTIWSYFKKNIGIVLVSLFFGVLFNVLNVVGPGVQGMLLDSLINGDSFNKILKWIFIFLGLVLVVQGSRSIKRYAVRKFANIVKKDMKEQVYKNTIYNDINYLDKIDNSDAMTKYIGDIEIAVEGLRKALTEVYDTGIALVAYIVILLIYDYKISLIIIVFMPVAQVAAYFIKKCVISTNKNYRRVSQKAMNFDLQLIKNTITYKNFGVMNKQLQKSELINDEYRKWANKSNILENCFTPLYKMISLMGIGIVIYFGAKNYFTAGWTIGKLTAYIAVFLNFSTKNSHISKLFNTVSKSKVSWDRISSYFLPPEQFEIEKDPLVVNSFTGHNFTFSYGDKKIFKPVDFSFTPGDIVWIKGAIASGKTTMLLALSNIYGHEGELMINNKEINTYSKGKLKNVFSLDTHDPHLFSASIEENITLGRDVDYKEFLHKTNLYKEFEVVGTNKEVGSFGVKLSGGQKARLALARALSFTSPILLLDDPFASLDKNTELDILKMIKNDYKDKIIIITSHKETIADYANKVINLEANND